jgi:hypothetical protein
MTFKGDLETINLPDILQVLNSARKTGALSIRRGAEEKRLYFKDGMLVFASSTDEREKLGNVLIREGLLTEAEVERAVRAQGLSGRSFGLSLVEQGSIPHDKMIAGLKQQARLIVANLFRWWGGEFEFREENLTWPEGVSVGFDIQGIVLEAATVVDEWNYVKKQLPELNAVLEITPAPAKAQGEVRFDEREWHIMSLVTGARSATEIAALSHLSDLEACTVMSRLCERGFVQPRGARTGGGAPPARPTAVRTLLAVYNELFAQVFFAVADEGGFQKLEALNTAMAAACADRAPFLAGCWQAATGTLDRDRVTAQLLAADPELREEELAASVFALFRDELELTASILSRPKQAALIGDLQPLAALLLKKHDPVLMNLGVRRVLNGFLSPTSVSYAGPED